MSSIKCDNQSTKVDSSPVEKDPPVLFDIYHRLITTNELAKFLGYHPGTVRRWVSRERHFPKYTFNGQHRYLVSEVLSFLRKNGKDHKVCL